MQAGPDEIGEHRLRISPEQRIELGAYVRMGLGHRVVGPKQGQVPTPLTARGGARNARAFPYFTRLTPTVTALWCLSNHRYHSGNKSLDLVTSTA